MVFFWSGQHQASSLDCPAVKGATHQCTMQSDVCSVLWGNITYFLTLLPWGKVKVKVTQSCLILCDPMDYTVPGTLQARILEWVTFPFSRESSQPRDWTQVSCIAGKFFTSWATKKAHTVGDPGLIPGLERCSGEWNGNPLQYSCLENPMYRKVWWATVQMVAKIITWLSN